MTLRESDDEKVWVWVWVPQEGGERYPFGRTGVALGSHTTPERWLPSHL